MQMGEGICAAAGGRQRVDRGAVTHRGGKRQDPGLREIAGQGDGGGDRGPHLGIG